jgi:hypothetical protein
MKGPDSNVGAFFLTLSSTRALFQGGGYLLGCNALIWAKAHYSFGYFTPDLKAGAI